MGAFVAAPLGLLACSSGGLGPGPVRLSRRRQTGATVPPRTGRVAAARPAVLPSMVASGPDGDFSRRAFVAAAAASAAAAALSDLPVTATAATAAAPSTFFDLTATRGGEPTPLRDLFDDKVTLVVNVATYCALTPQYEGLVALHRTFAAGGEGKAGFDIAAFPCNQVRFVDGPQVSIRVDICGELLRCVFRCVLTVRSVVFCMLTASCVPSDTTDCVIRRPAQFGGQEPGTCCLREGSMPVMLHLR